MNSLLAFDPKSSTFAEDVHLQQDILAIAVWV